MCQVVRRRKEGEMKLPLTRDKTKKNDERRQTTIRWDKNQKERKEKMKKREKEK